MHKELIQTYIDLFTSFLSKQITDQEFESTYFEFYLKRDRTIMWPDPIFLVLDGIFFVLDEYSHDPTLRNEGDIDEAGLREEVRVANEKLRTLNID